MNIVWLYLDKKTATVNAIKDFDKMKYILEHTDEEIAKVREGMEDIGSPNTAGVPSGSHNPHSGEEKIVNGIDEIDVLKERYRQAKEYMDWFLPAWNELSENDRFVLSTFYDSSNEYGSGSADLIAEYYGIERSSAYRKKERALDNLRTLLFGRW